MPEQSGTPTVACQAPVGVPRSRRRLLIVAAVAFLIVLAGAQLARHVLAAKRAAAAASAQLPTLRAMLAQGRVDPAALAPLRQDIARARSATSGPLWAAAGAIPRVGANFRAAATLARSSQTFVDRGLPAYLDAANHLQPGTLRAPDGSLELDGIHAASASLDTALQSMDSYRLAVQHLPSRGLVGPLDRARADLSEQLQTGTATTSQLVTATRLAPEMLGFEGRRRYFVAFQNPAEARGTGGLVGAYAIVDVVRGKARLVEVGSDSDLRASPSPVVQLDAEQAARYAGYSSDSSWTSSNLTPDFPQAARTWAALWKAQGGGQVDGVVSVDPEALSGMLAVTGPVRTRDGTRVTAGNIVPLTMSQAYTSFSDSRERKAFLREVVRTSFTAVLDDHRAWSWDLLSAMQRQVDSGRLRLASMHPEEQTQLRKTSLAGALPRSDQPFAELVVVNAGGNKLDYYLHRELNYRSEQCGSQRRSTIEVTLTNAAPAGLPAYVRGDLSDRDGSYPRDGTNRTWASLFATAGAQLTSATVDGSPVGVEVSQEAGHPVFGIRTDIAPGSSRTWVLHLVEPAAGGGVTIPEQPLVVPQVTRVSSEKCTTGRVD